MQRFAIAYNGKDGRPFAPNEPFLNVEIDDYSAALSAAEVLKGEGYFAVTVFSYEDTLDEKAVTWDFVEKHAVQEPSKQQCIAALQDLKKEIEGWEWDEDYFKSGFQTPEDQMAWALHLVNRSIEIVQEAPSLGGVMMQSFQQKERCGNDN